RQADAAHVSLSSHSLVKEQRAKPSKLSLRRRVLPLRCAELNPVGLEIRAVVGVSAASTGWRIGRIRRAGKQKIIGLMTTPFSCCG
ncbi:hypothetical protein, partial [Chthonobacter albigriseus]|uniref:hypothetical protein n=1 Tax=Chthonobacter albigriseus TaxID=1683161 RepID=UPI0019D511D4